PSHHAATAIATEHGIIITATHIPGSLAAALTHRLRLQGRCGGIKQTEVGQANNRGVIAHSCAALVVISNLKHFPHAASLKVDNGDARNTPDRANRPASIAANIPAAIPTGQGHHTDTRSIWSTRAASTHDSANDAAAANTPEISPDSSNSRNSAERSRLARAPSARMTATSCMRPSRVACKAAANTSTPANKVKANNNCTAVTACSSIFLT